MEDLSGKSIGRYHVIEPLGQGGMAVVYKAFDTNLECEVAIKFIRLDELSAAEAERTLKRFSREARETAQLLHPNIVPVTDFGQYENIPYLVMKYIPGGTLKSRMKALGRPVIYQEAARMLAPIARALESAHKRDLVHRDIKPSNILITPEGQPMLSDFGIAKILDHNRETTDLTGVGMAIGTPEYMAPEQWEGKPVDGRVDIYALGVVFYEMVTGRPPFTADTVPAIMVKVLRDPLPRPRDFVPGIPEHVEQVLFKALARDPHQRYHDMGAFAAALEHLATEPLEPEIEAMFNRGLAAYQKKQYTAATQLFTDIVRYRPDYTLRGVRAAALLEQAKKAQGKTSIPAWAWVLIAIGGIGFITLIIIVAVVLMLAVLSPAASTPTQTPTRALAPTVAVRTATPAAVYRSPTPPLPTAARTAMPTSSPMPATAPAANLAEQIVVAIAPEPVNLHPLLNDEYAKELVLAPVYLGCARQDAATAWVALGCESVPSLQNGGAKIVGSGTDMHLEVTYKIRKGWRWTDGTPVTAKDAVFYWKTRMNPKLDSPYGRDDILKIYEISIVDDLTFVVKFMSETQAQMAAAGTLPGAVDFSAFQADYFSLFGAQWKGYAVDTTFGAQGVGWLPSHILGGIPPEKQGESDYARLPVGDGPYVIKQWLKDNQIVLERSAQPFPLGEARTKTIVFKIFPGKDEVLDALRAGTVDIAPGNAADLYDSYYADIDRIIAASKYQVDWTPRVYWEHVDFNVSRFPLDDVKVRQALGYAINKTALNSRYYGGKRILAEIPFPRGFSWFYPDTLTKYEYNLEKARALLKEAGWDCTKTPCEKSVSGTVKKLEFTLSTTDSASRKALAEELVAAWKQIGASVSVKTYPNTTLFATWDKNGTLSTGAYDVSLFTWKMTTRDMDVYGLYGCNAIPSKENPSGQNFPRWCNQAAENSLKQAETDLNTVMDRTQRRSFYNSFYANWAADAPTIPLWFYTQPFVYRKDIRNIKGSLDTIPLTWNAWEWELPR